jgi:hypothetical protein
MLLAGWIALGVSTVNPGTMVNADILMGYVDRTNRAYLNDYWATAQNSPDLDTSNDVTLVAGSKSSMCSARYYCINVSYLSS